MTRQPIVIAIDGTSASGKSTNSKLVAKELGFVHVDTGAMYRMLAWYCLKQKVDVHDARAVATACRKWKTVLKCVDDHVLLMVDGQYPAKELRSDEVSAAVSQVAAIPKVRDWMKKTQRSCIQFGNLVMEGRDIGTNVFPETDFKYDLSSLRFCVSAGESLPKPLFDAWKKRFGIEILDGIGSTEMLHIFICNRPGQARGGTSGTVVPGYKAKIVDDDGRELGPGETGNLHVSGDSCCAFYWNKHEKSKATFRGEWTVTGDKYHLSADGYYTYEGRSDDMLKVSGQWVSPAEVEAALMEHAAVLECGVVGAKDKDGLVKPRAFVLLKTGQKPSDALAEELKQFVKARIAPYKYPRWIEFVDELPKTATGKIQRFKLRELGGT